MVDYPKRLTRLRRLLRERQLKSLLVTNFTNVCYLTGFTGGDSYLLVQDSSLKLISDPRYEEQIAEEAPGLEAIIRKPSVSLLEATTDVIRKSKLSSMAIESDTMTVGEFHRLSESMIATPISPQSGLIETLREIKDDGEMERIARAIELAERAFASVRSRLQPQQTERDIANELEANIRHLGGKGSAFATIVGVGPRAALPHGVPSDRKLHEDAFVLIDWGANEGLYLSDLTRVLTTSRIPPKFERIYTTVLEAHRQAARALRPGALMKDIDQLARGVIEEAGFGKRFGHGLGHGFGMQIHESPRLAKNQERELKSGMVVTIEPGIYIPGFAGVRIEDDYWITEDGCQRLTHLPQELEENRVQWL